MRITQPPDSGNIEVIDAGDPARVHLQIRSDRASDDLHWFYFDVEDGSGIPCTFRLSNAGRSTFPRGWRDFRAVSSTDGGRWIRVATDYRDGVLTIRDTPASDRVSYAAFAPYPWSRHLAQLARWDGCEGIRADVLGTTLGGRDLHRLILPGPAGAPVVWVVARQHPGEPMAEWSAEGLVERWLGGPRPAVTVHVVPNCNPDGTVGGHLRTNLAGVDLNRSWAAPDVERCPEVAMVRRAMDASGVDLMLDVHGDEAMPWCFTSGPEGVPGIDPHVGTLHQRFRRALRTACADFQSRHGYGAPRPGRANLSICKNQVAHRFGCLAMTLEQPFKDNADAPDSLLGWSPQRAMALGAGCLDATGMVLPLRRSSLG